MRAGPLASWEVSVVFTSRPMRKSVVLSADKLNHGVPQRNEPRMNGLISIIFPFHW